MNKYFAFVLIFAVFACVVAGCAPKPKPTETPVESGTTPQAPQPAPSAEQPPFKPRFEVALYPNETFYRIDHPVEVTLILMNVSGETIELKNGVNFFAGFFINGRAEGVTSNISDPAFQQPIAVPPGGFIGRTINLSACFPDFAKPGVYTVHWFDPEFGRSDPIKIGVTTYVILMTDFGDVYVRLMPEVAPQTVAQFKRLANEGFYDDSYVSGIKSDGMVAVNPSETNLKDYAGKYAPLKQESPTDIIGPGDVIVVRRLDVQMLNAGAPERAEFLNSGSPSFFMQLSPAMPAGINYTVFGNVFKGQDVLFNISHARPARGSQGQTLAVPAEAIHINRVVIVDGPMQANPAPNIAPKDAVPETELSLAPQQEAFTYGEPIILRLMLKNPYDSSLQLPSMGLAKNLKITRLEENPGGELRRTEEKTNPDFSEMFLPVSRGLLGPGAQVGVRLDITDACPAFADGGTFEISWEAGGIKTKPLTLRIQKSLFANIATTRGVFQAILYPEAAPLAVGRFKQLAEDGFYNGLPFYAVVKTPALSLAQAGSKSGDSTGKATNLPDIPLEQSDRPFDIGTIGFSHTRTNADSGSSQFFIITQIGADGSASLFRRYTVIGKIISARDEKGDPADYRALLSKLTAEDKVLKIEISAKKTK